MRKVVITTLAVPFVLLVGYLLLVRVYTPDTIPADFEYRSQDLTVSAADGARIAATLHHVQNDTAEIRPLVVFVGERSLDRDWNSKSFSFRSGARLARILGGAGFHSIRYDHRGTGDTQASLQTRLDLELMINDVGSVARAGIAQLQSMQTNPNDSSEIQNIFFLAHDSGCAETLAALASSQNQPTGVILLSCDAAPTALDQWGEKLLFNMQRQGVDATVLDQARAEWQEFARTNQLPLSMQFQEIAPAVKPPPDLIAFREAVRYMASEKMDHFRGVAKSIAIQTRIESLVQRGVPVLHMIGEFDEELPPTSIGHTTDFARDLSKKYGGQSYEFVVIPRMNHFLKEQDEAVQGPGLLLERMRPFRKIQPAAITKILEFLKRNSSNP